MNIPIYTGDYPTEEVFNALKYNMIIDNNKREEFRKKWSKGEISDVFWIESPSARTTRIVVSLLKRINS